MFGSYKVLFETYQLWFWNYKNQEFERNHKFWIVQHKALPRTNLEHPNVVSTPTCEQNLIIKFDIHCQISI